MKTIARFQTALIFASLSILSTAAIAQHEEPMPDDVLSMEECYRIARGCFNLGYPGAGQCYDSRTGGMCASHGNRLTSVNDYSYYYISAGKINYIGA